MQKTSEIIAQTIEAHRRMLSDFERNQAENIAAIAQKITDIVNNSGTVYICGNGGSAADAQHIAGEFAGRFRKDRKPLPAIALSTDSSIMSCIANDYSFEDVFSRQVEALACEKDMLWCLSTSGSSPNIIKAARAAKQKNAAVLAFTGRKDSPLEKLADMCFCAADESTARSQEIHQLAYHIICDIVERNVCSLCSEPGAPSDAG